MKKAVASLGLTGWTLACVLLTAGPLPADTATLPERVVSVANAEDGGDDANPGTSAAPKATITAALAALAAEGAATAMVRIASSVYLLPADTDIAGLDFIVLDLNGNLVSNGAKTVTLSAPHVRLMNGCLDVKAMTTGNTKSATATEAVLEDVTLLNSSGQVGVPIAGPSMDGTCQALVVGAGCVVTNAAVPNFGDGATMEVLTNGFISYDYLIGKCGSNVLVTVRNGGRLVSQRYFNLQGTGAALIVEEHGYFAWGAPATFNGAGARIKFCHDAIIDNSIQSHLMPSKPGAFLHVVSPIRRTKGDYYMFGTGNGGRTLIEEDPGTEESVLTNHHVLVMGNDAVFIVSNRVTLVDRDRSIEMTGTNGIVVFSSGAVYKTVPLTSRQLNFLGGVGNRIRMEKGASAEFNMWRTLIDGTNTVLELDDAACSYHGIGGGRLFTLGTGSFSTSDAVVYGQQEGVSPAIEFRGRHPSLSVDGSFYAAHTNAWEHPAELRFAIPAGGYDTVPITVTNGVVALNDSLIIRVDSAGLDTSKRGEYQLIKGDPRQQFTVDIDKLNAHAALPKNCALVLGNDGHTLNLTVTQPGFVIRICDTDIRVPYSWISNNCPEVVAAGEAGISNALVSVGANGVARWESYALGLNPLDPASVLLCDAWQDVAPGRLTFFPGTCRRRVTTVSPSRLCYRPQAPEALRTSPGAA